MDEGREKPRYEKPEAVNLGGVAPVVGQSCVTGTAFQPGGSCDPEGSSAALACTPYGGSAGMECVSGIGFEPIGCFLGMQPV